MSSYYRRVETSGLLPAFERARSAHDTAAMRDVLKTAGFAPAEIESILWSHGNLGDPPTAGEKRKELWDALVSRLGLALFCGLILGGFCAYVSSGLGGPRRERMNRLMRDYRTPEEALYRPFVWGFAAGAVVGFLAGPFITGSAKKPPKS